MDNEQIQFLTKAELNCQDIEDLVDDYVDQEIIPELKKRFEEHFEGCERCRSLVVDIQEMLRLAGSLSEEPVPLSVSQRLRKVLRARTGFDPSQAEAEKQPQLTLLRGGEHSSIDDDTNS